MNNFVFFSLKYVQHGSKRKLKGIFGSAVDPTKEKEYQEKITLKNFKAYFFGFRNGVIEKPDPGWNIIEEEGIDFLVELIKKKLILQMLSRTSSLSPYNHLISLNNIAL